MSKAKKETSKTAKAEKETSNFRVFETNAEGIEKLLNESTSTEDGGPYEMMFPPVLTNGSRYLVIFRKVIPSPGEVRLDEVREAVRQSRTGQIPRFTS